MLVWVDIHSIHGHTALENDLQLYKSGGKIVHGWWAFGFERLLPLLILICFNHFEGRLPLPCLLEFERHFPLTLIPFWVWGRPPYPLRNPWALGVSVYSCSFVAVGLTSEPAHFRNSSESSSRPGRTFCPCWEGQWLKTLLDFILVVCSVPIEKVSDWKPFWILSLLCVMPLLRSDWKPFWILSLLVQVANEKPCVFCLLRRLVTETLLDFILVVCSVPVEKVSDWNASGFYPCWEG